METFEIKVWESPTNNFHTYERIDKIKVNGSNVTELRELYDCIESNVSFKGVENPIITFWITSHTNYIRKNTKRYTIADKPVTWERKLEY